MVCIVNVMHFNVESIGMVHMKQLMGSCWEAHINLLTDKFRWSCTWDACVCNCPAHDLCLLGFRIGGKFLSIFEGCNIPFMNELLFYG